MGVFSKLRLSPNDGKNGGHYNQVEDQEHLMSKDNADPALQEHYRALRLAHKRLQRWIKMLSFLLVLACVVLVLALANAVRKDRPEGGILSPVPPMPIIPVPFERDDRFAGPSSQENDQAWGALMPNGDGFILVDNSNKYNLPPGKDSPTGEIYDIALFHQLHCLSAIRAHLFIVEGSIGRNNSKQIQDIFLTPGREDHVFHCFDYIRQALMCAGDLTVEWPREEADGRRFAFDGWGVTHQCKSWDSIMKFMSENDVTNIWNR